MQVCRVVKAGAAAEAEHPEEEVVLVGLEFHHMAPVLVMVVMELLAVVVAYIMFPEVLEVKAVTEVEQQDFV
jgi:hypothetical protein